LSWRRHFARRRDDLDHAEEFRAHLEIQIEENLARGMSQEEARLAAHRKFGSGMRIREDVYTMNSIGFLEVLGRDLRYTLRVLGRHRGFTLAAVLCLALGIGATTAIFSVVNAVLLRPLPYARADRRVRLYAAGNNGEPGNAKFTFSGPELVALRREARSFEQVDGWIIGGANLTAGQEPVRPVVAFVTGGLMESLGVPPVRGHLLTSEDDRPDAPAAAVISYGLWQRLFGGDPKVLERQVRFSGRPCSIVGVMPKGFEFPPGEVDAPDLWTALQLDPAKPGSPFSHFASVIATLKPGVTIAAAQREMDSMVERLAREEPGNHFGTGKRQHHVAAYSFQEEIVGGARRALVVLLGAVGFVLIIACVNVANLLLARTESRRREIAVRKAIGAATGTLVRQFITEGVVLSLAGAVGGVGIAFAGVRLLTATNAGNIPRAAEIGIHWPVLVFTLALSVATGIAFGLAPLAQLTARNLHDTLKSATSRNTATAAANRFRHALVVSELALALVLLIGTGLMVQAFWKLQRVNPGFRASNLLTMTTTLPMGLYPRSDRVAQFWTDLQQRVSALPGVSAATMMSGLPPMRRADTNTTPIEGYQPAPDRPAIEIDYYQAVGPRYFETMGIRLTAGRLFDDHDGPDAARVVIVNQALERRVWPNGSALGHRMQVGGGGVWSTIVGVVADVKNSGIDQPAGTEVYFPFRQAGMMSMRSGYLAVRTAGPPSGVARAAREVVRTLDPTLPVNKLRDMDEVMWSLEARPRLLTVLLTAFAVLAVTLAAVGIYGVIAYSVGQRTSEFGIRIAMGAGSKDVLRLVLGQGLALGGAGLVLGAIGAYWLTGFLSGVLFGISAVDPATFAAMAVLLAAVTLAACYVPARRATKVDPTIALRYE
jgi:putative ABC transport system permease protein